jgi:indolepyruvate ferredoxin oxidoreductase alpha subunit
MTEQAIAETAVEQVLLGDEAVALGAVHAGISAAYAYPGTPSTEILQYLLDLAERDGGPMATWCANEKTAYEEALGVSMAGKRVLVAMKHVGLNVAADPFVNSGVVWTGGGIVLAVADDPGMHSSQNEQDSRWLADFAHIPCLEPSNQQQAYDMTREAFEISERFRIPVMVRLVTRLAHSRARIETQRPLEEKPLDLDRRHGDWILLPAFARRHWHERLNQHSGMKAASEASPYNVLEINPGHRDYGVITCGIAGNYFLENADDLEHRPSRLQIGSYPMPMDKIRELADAVDQLLVIEEGYPYVERLVRGILPSQVKVLGKQSGHLPPDGELTPDTVRWASGLPEREGLAEPGIAVVPRPPRLCAGCPHCDAYTALNKALSEFDNDLVTSDIGCYTLGLLPPYSVGESCVCMGASIGMAKGSADAGIYPVVAVIGDSTFLHSGITPLMDAVAADSDMTVLILDNEAVAMTGAQPTLYASSRVERVVLGLGADPEHCHVFEAHPKKTEELSTLIRREIDHRGLSVIITVRECLESVRKKRHV